MNNQEDIKLAENEEASESRRSFLKKGAYAAPAILTLSALPAFAKAGSTPRKQKRKNRKGRKSKKNKKNKKNKKSK